MCVKAGRQTDFLTSRAAMGTKKLYDGSADPKLSVTCREEVVTVPCGATRSQGSGGS